MAGSYDEQPVPAGLFVVGGHTSELRQFVKALRASGVAVLEHAPASAPLIVAITAANGDLPAEPTLVGREVIPVTFLDTVPDLFSDVSHIRPRLDGAQASVSRVSAGVRFGGKNLAQWNRLASAADRWSRSLAFGHRLSEREQDSALMLLASPIANDDSEISHKIRGFLDASRASSARRRRAWRLIGVAVAIVLATAAGVSLAQGLVALAEGRRSLDSANLATASRLLSEAAASSGQDPDLPLVLAGFAGSISTDPDITNAVAAISATQVRHSSFPLVGPGRLIASSGSGLYAYTTWNDAVVRVVDASGAQVWSIDLGTDSSGEVDSLLLSSGGDLVVISDDDIRLFGVLTGGDEEPTSGDPSLDGTRYFGWWDSTTLLATDESAVIAVDPRTGVREILVRDETGSAPIAVSASVNRQWIVTSDAEQVRIYDVAAGELHYTAQVDHISQVAVDETGNTVFGLRGLQLVRIGFDEGEPEIDYSDATSPPIALKPLVDGYVAVADQRGRISIYTSRAGATAVTRFPAHLGESTRLAVGDDGILASVGMDGYLRVWDTVGLANIGTPTVAGVSTSSSLLGGAMADSITAEVFPAATFRNQIRVTESGDYAVVVGSGLQAPIVSRSDPMSALGGLRAPLFGRGFLAEDGRSLIVAAARQGEEAVWLEVWPIVEGKRTAEEPRIRAQVDLMSSRLGLEPFLVTADEGAGFAVATASELSSFLDSGELSSRTPYIAASAPLAISSEVPGRALVVTADGTLHSTDGSVINLNAELPSDAGEGIVAAEFSGARLLVLTESGALCEWAANTMRIVAPVGTLSGAGTLRVDRGSGRIAYVGADAVIVLDANGQILGRIPTVLNVRVADVDFEADSIVVVTRIGTIASFRIEELQRASVSDVPRDLTVSELLLFGLEGTHG